MKLGRLLLLALVLSVFVVGFATAQDVVQPTCSTEDYTALADALIEQAEVLKTAEDQALQLSIIQGILATSRANCGGLVFTSDEYGLDAVIGPVLFDDGFYRVTFTGETFGSMVMDTMEGECDLFATLFISDMGGGTDTGSYEFTGCVALIELSTTQPWTLTFEPLN